jgi:hypothetical protein
VAGLGFFPTSATIIIFSLYILNFSGVDIGPDIGFIGLVHEIVVSQKSPKGRIKVNVVIADRQRANANRNEISGLEIKNVLMSRPND